MIYEYVPYQMFQKLKKSRPRPSRRIYEYIPYQMSRKSSRKVDQELQGRYISILLTKCVLEA